MSQYDYEATEALLRRLLLKLGDIFTAAEADEVRDLIDANEYGLALETLADIVREEHKSFPFELVSLVKELCGLMEIDFGEFEEKLKS